MLKIEKLKHDRLVIIDDYLEKLKKLDERLGGCCMPGVEVRQAIKDATNLLLDLRKYVEAKEPSCVDFCQETIRLIKEIDETTKDFEIF